MSEYQATVRWKRRSDEEFIDNHYSRGHSWIFDGGLTIPASASPHVVPEPYSVPANVDPEEAFVAALSSCHMLFFLAIAAKKRFVVDSYVDHALGILEANESGQPAMTRVTLRPQIQFSGSPAPTPAEIQHIHHLSHEKCYIANSVRSEVVVEGI